MRIDGLMTYLRSCAEQGKSPVLTPSDARVITRHYEELKKIAAQAQGEKS
jgi:hypothetical protein